MNPDIAIVGGGVIGCAVARSLAIAGAGRIVLLERAQLGAEASSAAAGLLVVASSRAPGGALFELRRASAALFPRLVEELRDETGIDAEYSSSGLLDLAFGAREAQQLRALVGKRRGQGFAAELLAAAEAGRQAPGLSRDVKAAGWFPDDRSIHPVRLVEALAESARRHGVELRLGTELTGIERAGSRLLAVRAGGERIEPGHLIVAAGVGSAAIGELLRVKVPVRPDRGEMLALKPRRPLACSLSWGDGYLVARRDGEVLVGSTSARNVTDKIVTASSLSLLLARAIRMVPDLEDAELLRTWAGLRPMSTIRRPILAPLRGYENVTLAVGHHRSGILLAPITAQLITELLTRRETSMSLVPFSYRAR